MKSRNPTWRHALAALAMILSCCPAFAEKMTSTESRGQALLAKNCSRCHAIGRTGASPHPVAPPFRTLSQKYPIEGLAEALGEGIYVGHTDMPEFAFEPKDVGAIIAYLKSIQERRP
jgi:cytochrome c